MQTVSNESDFVIDEKVTVIKFWAAWCQPCKRLSPIVEKLEGDFENVKFISVDIDQVPALAAKYRVRTLPTLLFLKQGKEQNRVSGLSLLEPLRKILKELDSTQD